MSSSVVSRVLGFAADAERFSSLDALNAAVEAAVAGLGVRSVSTNMILVPGRDRRPGILFGQGDWRAWSQRYDRLRFLRRDPALRMLREQSRPFTWTEARQRYFSPGAEEVMDACRDYTGLEDALVVPLRDADSALLSVTFAGDRLELDGELRGALHLAGFYYALRGREILSGFKLEARTPLTRRQLECLTWVHRGKTDPEIAQILGIAARTVHNHVEAAKTRLDADKRSSAAGHAWRRGWIT